MYCYNKFIIIVFLLYLPYSTLDADKDGIISVKEAKACYEKVGLDDEGIEEAFNEVDKNSDGNLSLKGIYHFLLNNTIHS